MAILPADLYIAQTEKYREIARLALDVAREPGRMVVLGIPPTRPDTGFGYIQSSTKPISTSPFPVFAVEAFKEKPQLALAEEYVASGNYRWNAGMFFWRVSTFLAALQNYLPKTSAELGISRLQHRHQKLSEKTSLHLSAPRKYRRRLRHSRTRHPRIRRAPRLRHSRRHRLERHRLLDRGLRTIRQITRRQRHRQRQPRHRRPRQFHLEPRKIRRRHWRSRPGGRRNARRLADLPAQSLSGRRQNREMARRASQKRSALRYRLKFSPEVLVEVPIRLLAQSPIAYTSRSMPQQLQSDSSPAATPRPSNSAPTAGAPSSPKISPSPTPASSPMPSRVTSFAPKTRAKV